MNKRIVTLSVVSLLALMGMSGCEVSEKQVDGKDVIVTLGSGANEENFTADELFGDYLNTASGASSAFSAVYDVLVGAAVEETQEIKNYVDSDITDLQEKAETNAKANGTTYKEELSNLLESEDVEDIAEYAQKVKLSYQKEEFEDNYYESQLYAENLTSTKAVDTNTLHAEFIANENPYHVRHILVKVSATGNSFLPSSETISSVEAKNLANVIKNLASPSMTFGNVAEFYSEDGSSSNLGSLNELMGRKTSYVNEFKFAVFQYDAYINGNVKDGAKSLAIPETIKNGSDTLTTEDVVNNSVNFIPFSVADELLKYAETTKSPSGESYKDGKNQYFPRNILFNNYFSNHGLSFIYRDSTAIDATRFKEITVGSQTKEVLCDENGRPILVTRAGTGTSDSGYQGIHFIVIENSPLVNENKVGEANYAYSLAEEVKYYSTYVPKTNEDVTNDKRYVTFINTDKKSYGDRANEIENAVKSYDSNIKFRLYDEVIKVLNEKGITVEIDSRIAESIETYIEATKARSELTKTETYNDSWRAYVNLLQTQADFAGYKLPLTEIDNFMSN